MEIDGINPLVATSTGVQRPEASKRSEIIQKSAEDRNPDSDRVELSVRGLGIAHLEELIRSTPNVREARIEQVRKDLESGNHNVKAEKIAEKIIGVNLLGEIF